MVDIQYRMAEVEEAAGNLPLALRYALASKAQSQRIGQTRVRNAEQILSRLYERLDQPRAALTHYRRYVDRRDNVQNEQNQKLALRQRLRDEYGQKEAALKAAQAKRQAVAAAEIRRQKQLRTAAMGGAGLLLLLAGGLYFAFRRSERLKQLVTDQKQDLQAQRDQLTASLAQLRAAQARLVQQEKMASLGALTAGIAHEIQNPLNFVNNFAEVSVELLDELEEDQRRPTRDAGLEAELVGDLRQNLGKIHQHGQRAAGIVRGMLEHARHSSGEHTPTDLNQLADEYLRLAYQGLRAKDNTFNAQLDTDFAPGLPPVPMVGADVGRVLLNLLNNAFYAVRQRQQTGEAGYEPLVSVRTKQAGQQVEIRVADNGPGMPESVQAKLFQPFFTTKPTGEGTGLGLSLSHDIITQGHCGSLTVESREGQGTTFSVALPLNGVSP